MNREDRNHMVEVQSSTDNKLVHRGNMLLNLGMVRRVQGAMFLPNQKVHQEIIVNICVPRVLMIPPRTEEVFRLKIQNNYITENAKATLLKYRTIKINLKTKKMQRKILTKKDLILSHSLLL